MSAITSLAVDTIVLIASMVDMPYRKPYWFMILDYNNIMIIIHSKIFPLISSIHRDDKTKGHQMVSLLGKQYQPLSFPDLCECSYSQHLLYMS